MHRSLLTLALCSAAAIAQQPAATPHAIPPLPKEVALTEWQMQAAPASPAPSSLTTPPTGAAYTYRAIVPGTALTTLIHNGIYPDPSFGENDRPEVIPETLAHTSFWYRTRVPVPAAFAGRSIWLNFNGINFSSEVWVNGAHIGSTRGAFIRSRFDISSLVHAGQEATIAVLVSPQPHPGVPLEHTVRAGIGKNGGITALDGPTFLSTIGWDWLPGVRDRDTGIWQRAFLSATGDVELKDPLITTDLPLPRTDSTDITLKTTVENLTGEPQHGVFTAAFGGVLVHHAVDLAPHESRILTLDPKTDPTFHMLYPLLWWPNGYGPQNLYTLHVSFTQGPRTSDEQSLSFGVRKITYALPGSDNLAISVNGVPIFIRGGDWGLDEALKRVPYARLEAQFKMHQLANLNMIRNWVGCGTSSSSPTPLTAPTPTTCRPTSPTSATRYSTSATTPPSPSGALATKGRRRRPSTPNCAS
jgi:beta-galactosidase/beta-glucuronidase